MSFLPGNNSANYNSCADWGGQNGNVTTVGSNGGPSSYGTYDQSGQILEWNDLDGLAGSSRGLRGGHWYNLAPHLSSSGRYGHAPSLENADIGFRLSSRLNPLNLPYFVDVTDINNVSDFTGYGAVNYAYSIAQYPVTNCEYAEFLNAVASTDTYNLYNSLSSTSARDGIARSGFSGSYTYSIKTNMANKPVIFVRWFDCARYCNWLHNGKPSGSQNNSTTEDGAYTLNGTTTGDAVALNSGANYHIPTENEWYKAAYYKGGGTNAGYWIYATQSDNPPTCVTADSNGNGPVSSNYSCASGPTTTATPTTTPTITATPTLTVTPTNSLTSTNKVTPTPTKSSIASSCDRSAISVCLPGSILRANPNASNICFRVGGVTCCNVGEQPVYSNEICIAIPPPTNSVNPVVTQTPTPTATLFE